MQALSSRLASCRAALGRPAFAALAASAAANAPAAAARARRGNATTAQALQYDAPGPKPVEVLQLRDSQVPEPLEGQVEVMMLQVGDDTV